MNEIQKIRDLVHKTRRVMHKEKPVQLSASMKKTLGAMAERAENIAGIDAAAEDQLVGTEQEVADVLKKISRRRWLSIWSR